MARANRQEWVSCRYRQLTLEQDGSPLVMPAVGALVLAVLPLSEPIQNWRNGLANNYFQVCNFYIQGASNDRFFLKMLLLLADSLVTPILTVICVSSKNRQDRPNLHNSTNN
ncbi:MAG: hypothetical protein MUE44_23980 [Oscillatoriaceae cyanobacterium Prado104]|jgi:hypothetical protein|nr:hypothetical protein [Oscillatoriaceae cyanobacterium Prado104]